MEVLARDLFANVAAGLLQLGQKVVEAEIEYFVDAVVGEAFVNLAGQALGFVSIGAGHRSADGVERTLQSAEIKAHRARMPCIEEQQLGNLCRLDMRVLALVELIRRH